MAGNDKTVPPATETQQIFTMAEKEVEYRADYFNKIISTCYNKCADKRYKEAELYIGETSCIDRCVSKYYQVTNLIGQRLASGSRNV